MLPLIDGVGGMSRRFRIRFVLSLNRPMSRRNEVRIKRFEDNGRSEADDF